MNHENNCQHHQDLFVEALYDELDASQTSKLRAHLQRCQRCQTIYAEMQETLRVMDRRQLFQPDWQQFDARVQQELQKEIANPIGIGNRIGWVSSKWVLRLSSAAAILLMGILIGKYWLVPQQPLLMADDMAAEAALLTRTQLFLDQSQRLFLGIANLDDAATTGGMDVTRYRQNSQTLVEEGKGLKAALHDSRQQRLQRLVEDLERILMQMANLDAEGDIQEIEIIQNGLEQSGVLFKINIEALRRARPLKTGQQQQRI